MKVTLSLFIAACFLAPAALPAPATAQPPAPRLERPVPEALAAGQRTYDQHCAACHGLNGDGNGPAAVWLFPKPRNFSSGVFKIQSTPNGTPPTDEDLLNTVTRGMPGSSMPSFTYLSEEERRGVVAYVKHLCSEKDEQGNWQNRFESAARAGTVATPIAVPAEPALTVQSMAEGKELFTRLQCSLCHGETGAGDGANAAALKDNWGFPLRPRDFNTGGFRGGHTGRDLYLRIAVGMAGTPMPPFNDEVINPMQRWSLVHYIMSLRRTDIQVNDMLPPTDGLIHAERVERLPAEAADPGWERYEAARVTLNPLWPSTNPIPALSVRALHDGTRLAVLLQWRDAAPNGAPVRVQDFQDAAALQFSMNGTTPFLGMGDRENPVNIWQWKAGWQQAMSGVRPDVQTVYPSMHADLYPESGVLFRTAEAAENALAQSRLKSPVEDANAAGFGTFQSQPVASQNVQGIGAWFDGHWSVLLVRELQSADMEDVAFSTGKAVPVAFSVWDGAGRERNGRKVISNWHRLLLEPY